MNNPRPSHWAIPDPYCAGPCPGPGTRGFPSTCGAVRTWPVHTVQITTLSPASRISVSRPHRTGWGPGITRESPAWNRWSRWLRPGLPRRGGEGTCGPAEWECHTATRWGLGTEASAPLPRAGAHSHQLLLAQLQNHGKHGVHQGRGGPGQMARLRLRSTQRGPGATELHLKQLSQGHPRAPSPLRAAGRCTRGAPGVWAQVGGTRPGVSPPPGAALSELQYLHPSIQSPGGLAPCGRDSLPPASRPHPAAQLCEPPPHASPLVLLLWGCTQGPREAPPSPSSSLILVRTASHVSASGFQALRL